MGRFADTWSQSSGDFTDPGSHGGNNFAASGCNLDFRR